MEETESQKKDSYSFNLNGTIISITINKFACSAESSAMVFAGNTTVLTTCTVGKAKEIDFFPLSVDYEERMYAIGKIPGNFGRREGKPFENAVLNARMIDRAIRPLFPKNFRNEVLLSSLIFSVGRDNLPEFSAALGTSICLAVSSIPISEIFATVFVGMVDGKFLINPNYLDRKKVILNLLSLELKIKLL